MNQALKIIELIGGAAILSLFGSAGFITGRENDRSFVAFRLKNRPFCINLVKIWIESADVFSIECFQTSAAGVDLVSFQSNILSADLGAVFARETGISAFAGRLNV